MVGYAASKMREGCKMTDLLSLIDLQLQQYAHSAKRSGDTDQPDISRYANVSAHFPNLRRELFDEEMERSISKFDRFTHSFLEDEE